jgi:DNA (cytosine-5)-methyltransferase 1
MGVHVVSLFAGIGGFDLGLERAGCTVVLQVENDPFCQRVLAARWPDLSREHRREDVRQFCSPGTSWAARTERHPVDLLVGGFPCQDLSVAGKRAGLGGPRSSLFHEFVRIAHALAPTWGLVENVPGLVSSHHGRDLWTVLQGLRECWPAVGYRILDSQYFGIPQRRRRVFLVGGPAEAGVAQVLALFDGGEGHSPAGGEAGADIAYALAAGAGGSKFGRGRDAQDTYVTRLADPISANEGRTYTHEGRNNFRLHNVVTQTENGIIAFDTTQVTSRVNRNNPQPGDPCHPLAAGMHPSMVAGSLIRRLTPLECERLQGFPDGWTCLCQPLAGYAADPDAAALRCRCPDSPRYRALGNAVTVNVVEWLGHRVGLRAS